MRKNQSQEQTLGSQAPDIIVYPHRRRLMVYMFLYGACSLFFLAFFTFLIIIIVFDSVPLEVSIIALILMMGGGGAISIYATLTIADVLLSGEPLLVITHQGIRMGKVYGPFDIFFPWEEIETISMRGSMKDVPPERYRTSQTGLAIHPKDVVLFLSHFGPFIRLWLRLFLMGGSGLGIPYSALEEPIEEIAYQLKVLYGRELKYYHIQYIKPIERGYKIKRRKIHYTVKKDNI